MNLCLYSRAGCHLCEQMLAEIFQEFGADLPVEVVDVDTNPDLALFYGARVPVLTADGVEICCYHLDVAALGNYLQSRQTKV